MATLANRLARLEGGAQDQMGVGRAAWAKRVAGVPLDHLTDEELRAMCAVYGHRPPDYTTMSDDDLAAHIAALREKIARNAVGGDEEHAESSDVELESVIDGDASIPDRHRIVVP